MRAYIILSILLSLNVYAQKIETLKGDNGFDVVLIEDNRFPTYTAMLYFADGALSEPEGKEGLTEFMFGELTSGTNRFTQKEISENLEFYGVSLGSRVTHEYSVLSFGGLVKDIVPTTKKVCHLFSDAIFPEKELAKTKNRVISSLGNLVTDHSSVADRVFRRVSMEGSAFGLPTDGTLKSIKRLKSPDLKKHLNYYVKSVRKKLYLTGPRSVLKARKILEKECGFDLKNSTYNRSANVNTSQKLNPGIFLVPVPKSNQAQIRIGRILKGDEAIDPDLAYVGASYLGGGFTSPLMQEVRVKRGLTYSIGAFAGLQKFYGRAGISTFTPNEKLIETLNVVKSTIESINTSLSPEVLQSLKQRISGNYLFRFETSAAYLENLVFFDHLGRNYEELKTFPSKVQNMTASEILKDIDNIFSWSKHSIIVVGDASLKKSLSELGPVKVLNYKDFL